MKIIIQTPLLVLMLFLIVKPTFSILYPYHIYGRVKKNGIPQPDIDVRITNNATGDYDTVTTNAYGEYLVDLANFEHGYSDGDNITVTLLIDPIVEKSTYVDLTNHPDGREVLFFISQPTPVGGIYIPVNKLELLAPYIGLASTIILIIVATAVFVKYRKKQ